MLRRLALLAFVLAGCGGHDKAGGERPAGTRTIVVAVRDGTSRYLDPYAAAVARIAGPATRCGHG